MRLTPAQVMEKLANGTGDYDDGDIPGWLALNPDGKAVWESDGEPKVVQRFTVTITEEAAS